MAILGGSELTGPNRSGTACTGCAAFGDGWLSFPALWEPVRRRRDGPTRIVSHAIESSRLLNKFKPPWNRAEPPPGVSGSTSRMVSVKEDLLPWIHRDQAGQLARHGQSPVVAGVVTHRSGRCAGDGERQPSGECRAVRRPVNFAADSYIGWSRPGRTVKPRRFDLMRGRSHIRMAPTACLSRKGDCAISLCDIDPARRRPHRVSIRRRQVSFELDLPISNNVTIPPTFSIKVDSCMTKPKAWTAETIAIGSELLLGGRVDTNSSVYRGLPGDMRG